MEQEKVWDAIAERWAEFRNRPTEEVVDFLKNRKGKVLDLGCGSGRHFIESNDLKFYGVDFSSKLLEIAKDEGYVELKKGVSDKIHYKDETFDLVVFARVLHCVESEEKRRETLKEIHRVLKKDGEAIISTWAKGQSRTKNKGKEFYVPWTIGEEKLKRYTYIYDKDELEGELKEVGFEIISIKEDKNIIAVVRKK